MVKTTTLDSFQASLSEMPDPTADPFSGMELELETDEAYGLIQGKVRAWLDDRGIIAQEDEIRAKTNFLYGQAAGHAQAPVRDWRRPTSLLATGATYTVAPDGSVGDYTPIEAERELPGMPGHPEAPAAEPANGLKVPNLSEFSDGWCDSSALYQRAQTLIERHPDDLEHLKGMTLSFLWKAKGGKSRGRPIMGQCVKTGGLLKHFATSTFCFWLAADHVMAARYGDRQIEALLFRQLLAAGVAEVDENTGRGGGATLVPPDVSAYAAELRVYGLWESQLKSAAQAFRQEPLFDSYTYPAPIEYEHDTSAVMQAGADLVRELDEIRDGADVPTPLVCSVCNAPITGDDAPQYDMESPVVVLCEACGEDGVIDDGDEAGG